MAWSAVFGVLFFLTDSLRTVKAVCAVANFSVI